MAHTTAVHSYPGDPLRGYPAAPFGRRASPCPQDEGDDGGGGPARCTGADRRPEGRGEMMEGLGSFSIDREGGMPEKSKNRQIPSNLVNLRTPENAIFP